MKALLCRRFGAPEDLAVEDVAPCVPKSNEVVVRVRAAGVNFPDGLIIQDRYQIKPPLPFSPGGELAGEITAIGKDVTGYRVGQPVMAFLGWGAFAEEAVVPESRLVAMPHGMPFELGGAFLTTYGTCYHALHDRAALKPQETVLVLGAAGGIGMAAIELAKSMGARVIAAASSDEKLNACRTCGADEVINYSQQDLKHQLKVLTGGRGVDVVCDPVGGEFTEPAVRSMAWRGRYLVIGFAGGSIPRVALNLVLLKGCALVGVFWGDFVEREPEAAAMDMNALFELHRAGRIQPHISGRFGLQDASKALRALQDRTVSGKLIVVP